MLTAGAYNIFKLIVGIYLLFLIFLVVRYNRSLRKEKRINSYTLKNSKPTGATIGDALVLIAQKMVESLSKILSRSKLLVMLAKRKERYLNIFSNQKLKPIDFLSYKIITSGIFILISFIYQLMLNKYLTMSAILIIIFSTFILLEGYLAYLFYLRNRRLREQLLDAIVLMNNAFKAGKSIILALENIYNELDNEIGKEFKQVHTDVSKGLGIDEAFNRLASRTNLKEIDYISASITVMNKSGGNVVRVFERILQGYYARKKLEAETSAILIISKITIWVLMLMPVIFGTIITLVNKNYFSPLFNTTLGQAIFVVIMLLYILYLYVTTKIVKGVEVW